MEKILVALKNARAQIHALGTPNDEINNAHLSELDEIINILEDPNPSNDGFFYWVLKIGIQKMWVADGVDFTDKRAHAMLTSHFSHLYGHEVTAEVLSKPPDKAVAKEMGYESVAEYNKDRYK